MIVPYPPGGGTDVVARILHRAAGGRARPADRRSRTAAAPAAALGTEVAAKSAPDGYTFLFTLSSHTINPKLYTSCRYDVERDFVAGRAWRRRSRSSSPRNPSVAGEHDAGADRAARRRSPGKLSYASVGTGSPSHIAGELFKLKTGIDMVHIPYKGGGPAVTDTIGGQVPLLFVSMPAALAAREAPAAAARSRSRATSAAPSAPEVPTLAEAVSLPDYVVELVVRRVRAGEDAGADRRAACRSGAGAKVLQMPEVRAEAARAGRRGRSQHAGRARRVVKRRAEASGQR